MSMLPNAPRVTPFLWFDGNAEEAVDFYLAIFKNARRLGELRSPMQTTVPKGKVLTISFELDGQQLTALNGGPGHPFSDAVSFYVRCETQAEIDDYWSQLSAGGSEGRCGWLKDKFGISWQIVPSRMLDLIDNPKAMTAMMNMQKLDIAELERAGQAS